MSKYNIRKRFGSTITIALLFVVPLLFNGPYPVHMMIMAAVNNILASSLRLIALTGQLSLAHGGMMAVGAYTSCLLVMKVGISFWVALPLAGIASAGLAFMVGFAFVRIRGVYFAMVTVFFGEMITLTAEHWRGLTGGSSGIVAIPRPGPISIDGVLSIDFTSKADFYYLILVLMLISMLVLYAIEYSRIGVTLLSIAQGDFLAESVGVNTARFKVLAFCVGCFFAGIAGGFYSHYIRAINPRTFGFFFTIYVVVYMIVGGGKRFAGPVVGALFLTILPEFFRGLNEFQPFVFAGCLMAVLFFLPDGLVSLPARLFALKEQREDNFA